MTPTRENWIFFKDHVGMYVPRNYASVAGFIAGACWASPTFLDGFQAFVSVELATAIFKAGYTDPNSPILPQQYYQLWP